MKRYKLLDTDMKSHNECKWEIGVPKHIDTPGNELCSNQVFHYYYSPEEAVLFNPIHGNYNPARLFEVEIDAEIASDGIKGGCKRMTLVRELPLPEIALEKKVAFTIHCVKQVYTEKTWTLWADNWLCGKNRTAAAAYAAAYVAAAYAAAAYAAGAAVAAADAADYVVYAAAAAAAYATGAAGAARAAGAANEKRRLIETALIKSGIKEA
jgi:hypothetical protein